MTESMLKKVGSNQGIKNAEPRRPTPNTNVEPRLEKIQTPYLDAESRKTDFRTFQT